MFFCFLAKKVVDFGFRIQEPEYNEITTRVTEDASVARGKKSRWVGNFLIVVEVFFANRLDKVVYWCIVYI